MIVNFGRFELDQPARVLRLDGRDMALQPRVFELLVYLVQHRVRVVPKDELLDVLWSGVTVTEASLQRAVSLARAALRQGGMESAIRSFSRVGYRFCTEVVVQRSESDETDAEERQDGSERRSDLISAARRAVSAQLWAEAVSLYQQVENDDLLQGDDLDRWALALECLGTPSEAIPVLTRAVMLHALEGRDP